MGIPKVGKCCYVLDLKIGSILISAFLIANSIFLILLFFKVFAFDDYALKGGNIERSGLLMEGLGYLGPGISILYAIIQGDYRFMKIPTVFVFVVQCVILPAYLLSLASYITSITLFVFVILSVARLYFACVLWNYAEEMGGVELS